jgi:uncharacterized RDD family membrane protein YckC
MAPRSDVVPFPPGVADDEADDASGDEVVTGEAVALDLRPAGFALRAGGAALDMLIYLAGTYLLVTVVGVALLGAQVEDAVYSIVFTVALVAGLIVAPITVEVATRGRSVGKLAVGARIVRDDGGAIGFRHALIRGLAGLLEVYATLGGLAILMGLLSPRAKRLGDLMAGTYSQYERVSRHPLPPPLLPWGMEGWALVADVARMPEGLSRRVAQFLHESVEYEPARRAGIAATLANEVAPFVSPLPEVPAEILLIAVTAVRRDREARALLLESQRLERLAPVLEGLPHDYPSRPSESRSSS